MNTIEPNTTETIDRLFLELSHFTQATSAKELALKNELLRLRISMLPFVELVEKTSGRIPCEKLSGADWHALVKAFRSSYEIDDPK